ncbi:MAG: hypothetical protein M3Y72_18820 [Acidobacteriota bacterium]|nr:hypothetical protein [Acidobacteriota bacterium]
MPSQPVENTDIKASSNTLHQFLSGAFDQPVDEPGYSDGHYERDDLNQDRRILWIRQKLVGQIEAGRMHQVQGKAPLPDTAHRSIGQKRGSRLGWDRAKENERRRQARIRKRMIDSVRPEKAGVGGSIPSLATIFSTTYE